MDLGESPKRRDGWSETELRIWGVGGWRFQLKGGRVHHLDGPTAEEALARHLAVRHLLPSSAGELQQALSRKPGRSISKQSLHVATNKLRALIASAAGGGQGGRQLAKRLLPHASAITDDGSRTSAYGFDPSVWVDLIDAPNPFAFQPLAIDRDPVELRGGARSRVFADFEQVGLEAEERLEETRRLSGELPKHLEAFTPPIERLADLIPVALDRLSPGSMLVLQGKGESGRLHLTEAIELATLGWCDRGAEQIRAQPEAESLPSPDPKRASPGHLYILDRTRELTAAQEKRLLAVHEHAAGIADLDQRPALLVVTDGTPLPLGVPFACWRPTETISLPNADSDDAKEAYLIATRGLDREREEREAEFETLAGEYEEERKSKIGLRAASSAASITVDEARVPSASELPPPDVEDLPLGKLKGEERELARALAWFRDDHFTLEDARAATECPGLPRSKIFRIATKIPGGGAGTYEIHPRLLKARPDSQVPSRICKYLLEAGHDDAIERWPLRAMRILDTETVDIGLRLRLAPKLVELSRDLGFAGDLQKTMGKLLERAEEPDVETMMKASIGRARLLSHLGQLEDAEEVLEPITGAGDGRPRKSRAEAQLRLAIAASQRGHREVANKRAREAVKLSAQLEERVERYYGWAALYSADFEAALGEFEKALAREQRPEDRADAKIGATLALLRLGRLEEAEGILEELDVTGLRSTTRNRVIRAEATARFLRGDPEEGIKILDKALGRDETRASFQSADLLEARAYLHAKLGGESLPDAERDLARSEKLLKTEDEWQKAVIYYLKGLVAEVKMHTAPYALEELRAEARESGVASVEAAKANPWLQARAHTLLARLEVDEGGDGARLAWHLRAASIAHRELPSVCPDVLHETLELGALAARAWGARDESRRLEVLAAELGPRDEPAEFDSQPALALLDEVAYAAETRERAEIGDADDLNVRSLGTLGEVLLRGAEEALARSMPLSLRLLHPRSTPSLPAGAYDLRLPTGTLTPTPDLPVDGTSMLKGRANRSFAEQRLGLVLLVSMRANPPGESDFTQLGEWLEIFRSATRKRGVAAIGSIPIEPRVLKALGLHDPARYMALGLAELPSLS